MTTRAWFNSTSPLEPGAEIFHSDRRFQLWAYSVSHGQLLFRSTGGPDPGDDRHVTTIDVLFKPAEFLKIRDDYDGLRIRLATIEEADRIKASMPSHTFQDDDLVFLLESQGETDYIISLAVGWHEDILGPTRQSFFNSVDPDMPQWPTEPLFGSGAGFNVASAEELIEALRRDTPEPVRRERWRIVYAVMTRVDRRDGRDISGAGVFLTQADAEDARAMIAPSVADCWIETLPIAI